VRLGGWVERGKVGRLTHQRQHQPMQTGALFGHSLVLYHQTWNDPAELEEDIRTRGWAKTVRETLHGPNEYPKQLTMDK